MVHAFARDVVPAEHCFAGCAVFRIAAHYLRSLKTGKGLGITQLEEEKIASVAQADLKLEVVVIPVSDVGRAKSFYAGLGWRLDADFAFDNGFQVAQFTRPGSGTSVQFGSSVTSAAPGSAQSLYVVVSDIAAAREQLAHRGAAISEVFHQVAPGAHFQPGAKDDLSGPAPDHLSYRSYATFSDPGGNTWLLQGVTRRLPGCLDPVATSFASISDLSTALQRPAMAHGEHEKRIGGRDDAWPDWYAAYMVAEQAGAESPR